MKHRCRFLLWFTMPHYSSLVIGILMTKNHTPEHHITIGSKQKILRHIQSNDTFNGICVHDKVFHVLHRLLIGKCICFQQKWLLFSISVIRNHLIQLNCFYWAKIQWIFFEKNKSKCNSWNTNVHRELLMPTYASSVVFFLLLTCGNIFYVFSIGAECTGR